MGLIVGYVFYKLLSREAEPLTYYPVKISDYYDVKARIDAFEKALDENKAAELILSTKDANAFIQFDPTTQTIRDFIVAKFDGDKAKGQISFPIDEFKALQRWTPKGVFLNGLATFSIRREGGLIHISIEELIIKGQQLQEQFMKALREDNLARIFYRDPQRRDRARKINFIQIRNHRLIMRSSGAGGIN